MNIRNFAKLNSTKISSPLVSNRLDSNLLEIPTSLSTDLLSFQLSRSRKGRVVGKTVEVGGGLRARGRMGRMEVSLVGPSDGITLTVIVKDRVDMHFLVRGQYSVD